MRTWIIPLVVVALTASLCQSGRADVGIKPPPAKKNVAYKIELDEKAKSPTLVIPFTALNFQGGELPKGGFQKGELDQDGGDGIAATPLSESRTSILIAGVALALSLSFGGIWVLRNRARLSTRTIALFITAGVCLATATIVWANGAPPKLPPQKKGTPLPVLVEGKLTFELSQTNDPIRLIIDKETLEKLKKDAAAPKE